MPDTTRIEDAVIKRNPLTLGATPGQKVILRELFLLGLIKEDFIYDSSCTGNSRPVWSYGTSTARIAKDLLLPRHKSLRAQLKEAAVTLADYQRIMKRVTERLDVATVTFETLQEKFQECYPTKPLPVWKSKEK